MRLGLGKQMFNLASQLYYKQMVIVLLFLTNGLFYFFCLKILNWNLILFLLLIKITKHYIINLLKYFKILEIFFIVYITYLLQLFQKIFHQIY